MKLGPTTATGEQTAFDGRSYVEETVLDVDARLDGLRLALHRLSRDHKHLSENEVLALRARLLHKADRWLDCRLAISGGQGGA